MSGGIAQSMWSSGSGNNSHHPALDTPPSSSTASASLHQVIPAHESHPQHGYQHQLQDQNFNREVTPCERIQVAPLPLDTMPNPGEPTCTDFLTDYLIAEKRTQHIHEMDKMRLDAQISTARAEETVALRVQIKDAVDEAQRTKDAHDIQIQALRQHSPVELQRTLQSYRLQNVDLAKELAGKAELAHRLETRLHHNEGTLRLMEDEINEQAYRRFVGEIALNDFKKTARRNRKVLMRQINALHNDLADSDANVAALERDLASHRDLLLSKRENPGQVTAQLDGALAREQGLRHAINHLTSTIATLRSNAQSTANGMTALQTTNKKQESRISSLIADKNMLQNEKSSLDELRRRHIRSRQLSMTHKDQRILTLCSHLSDLEADMGTLHTDYERMVRDLEAQIENEDKEHKKANGMAAVGVATVLRNMA